MVECVFSLAGDFLYTRSARRFCLLCSDWLPPILASLGEVIKGAFLSGLLSFHIHRSTYIVAAAAAEAASVPSRTARKLARGKAPCMQLATKSVCQNALATGRLKKPRRYRPETIALRESRHYHPGGSALTW